MKSSSRFAVGVHILTLLAAAGDRLVTSQYLAGSANTNPVVVRRILGALRDAGLVTVQAGAGGGSKLARPAERIPLLEVYRAVENGQLFALHSQQPDPSCLCGRNIQPVLEGVFGQAQAAMEKELAGVTVAHVVEAIEERACQPLTIEV